MSEQINEPGADATLQEDTANESGWTRAFDEEDRSFIRNKGWGSPGDLLQSYRHLERKIGANTVRLPGPGAAPDEVTAFWSRLGRPETSEGYDLRVPEDVPNYSSALADWFREAAHSVDMPFDMAQQLHDRYVERFIEDSRRTELEAAHQAESAEAALRAEWGAGFERKRQLANRAIRALGGDSLFAELQATGMANSATLARAFASVGERLYAEDRFIEGDRSLSFAPSPEAARQEIRRLRTDGGFMAIYGNRSHPDHETAQARMDQLYAAASDS